MNAHRLSLVLALVGVITFIASAFCESSIIVGISIGIIATCFLLGCKIEDDMREESPKVKLIYKINKESYKR